MAKRKRAKRRRAKRRNHHRAPATPKRKRAKSRSTRRRHKGHGRLTTVSETRKWKANPRRRSRARRHGRRRHRRNPGIPTWALGAIAVLVSGVTYAVVGAGAYALTQRLDEDMGTLQRNRYIAAGLAAAGGVALAFVSLPLGLAVAGGAFVSAFGSKLVLALGDVLDKPAPKKMAAVYGQMGAYRSPSLAGYQPMGAVYGNMGNAARAFVPAPPWVGNNPLPYN